MHVAGATIPFEHRIGHFENTESESVPDRARSVLGCLLLADADGLICAVGTVTVEEVELGRAALAVVELAFVVATFARTLAHRARVDLASSVWMRLAEKHLLVGVSAVRVLWHATTHFADRTLDEVSEDAVCAAVVL